MATCKSCGASILWVTTKVSGRRMPLNAEPDPQGQMVLRAGEASYLPLDQPWAGARYTSHHATCPQADSWRKKKPPAQEA